MRERSARTMELFLFVLFVVVSSAADVQDVVFKQSVLDVYAPTSQRPLFNSIDLYQSPVIVLANTTGQQDSGLVAYYADNGIRSIVDSRKFQPLFQLLRSSPNISGLVVGYQGLKDNSFLLNVVREFVLPDNFKLFDLVRESVYTVPIVYVAPKGNENFEDFEHVAKFVVDDFNIDQVPFKKSSQPSSHQSGNTQVVLIPIFTQSQPQFSQYAGYNPLYYQHYGSFPFKYQNYQVLNSKGTNSFPYFGLEPGLNPVGYNYQYPNRYPYSFYTLYPTRFHQSK